LMRRTEVEQALRIGRSTIYGLMSQGKFPKPIRVSPRSVAWRISEIEDYLEKLQGGF
jgi:prophage regulatory protein